MKLLIELDIDGVDKLPRKSVVAVVESVVDGCTAREAIDDGLHASIWDELDRKLGAGHDSNLCVTRFAVVDAGDDNTVEMVRDIITALRENRMKIERYVTELPGAKS